MSRAFVKEVDGEETEDLPARPVSPHPNYVTPAGAHGLQQKAKELQTLRNQLSASDDIADKQRLKSVERDLRYFDERVRTAVTVAPSAKSDGRVYFGSAVQVEDPEGNTLSFTIVGEDEAEVAQGKISWVSPLAKALLDSQVDDTVIWRRPAGDMELTIVAIDQNPG